MGGRKGFEYEHAFEVVGRDEIKLSYIPKIEYGVLSVVFEVRTIFVVRCSGRGDEVVGSETFNSCMVDEDHLMSVEGFYQLLGVRMKHYWMSDEEIDEIAKGALALVDERGACLRDLAMVVNLKVCSVQLEVEEIGDVRDRAISEGNLCSVCMFKVHEYENLSPLQLSIAIFASRPKLKKTRVEDVEEGLRVMESCGICKGAPKLGALILELPACKDTFHFHCIINWLEGRRYFCPLCKERIDKFIGYRDTHLQSLKEQKQVEEAEADTLQSLKKQKQAEEAEAEADTLPSLKKQKQAEEAEADTLPSLKKQKQADIKT